MSGPSSERDRSEASTGASDRRRPRAAARKNGPLSKGLRTVRRYVWNRKYTLIYLALMVLLAFAVRSVW